MSYDFGIGPVWINYTSNVGAVFYDHIADTGKRGGLHELHGLTGKQASQVLERCWDNIHASKMKLWENGVRGEPELCAKYDAPNGWGSFVGALIFLGQMTSACALHPKHKVRIGA